MNISQISLPFLLIGLLTGSSPPFAADDCPLGPTGARAAWCSYGLAGGFIPIARTGNKLDAKLLAEYRICIAERVPPGSWITVFHEAGQQSSQSSSPKGAGTLCPPSQEGRTTLCEANRCGCFAAPVLQVQFSGPTGVPQDKTIGGTYQAYVSGQCSKLKAPIKISKARHVIAQCRDVGDGSECDVPLPKSSIRDFRLCFLPGYLADSGRVGYVKLRANGFVPDPGNDGDPRDPNITVSCMDVYGADTLKIVVVKRNVVNKTAKIQLQTIYAREPK